MVNARRAALSGIVLLVVLSLFLQLPLAAAGGFLMLLVGALAAYYQRYGLMGVALRVKIHPGSVFPDEQTELALAIGNPKRVPLPFLTLEQEWPAAVTPVGRPELLGDSSKPGRKLFRLFTHLGGRQQVSRRYQLTSSRRGRHVFGPQTLRLYDPIGLLFSERHYERPRDLASYVVYPKLRPVRSLPAVLRAGGEWRARSLLEDPTLLRSLRQWQAGDAMKQIDWRASARSDDDLYVRQPESVSRLEVYLGLNLQSSRETWGGLRQDYIEEAVSLTASLAWDLLGTKHPVGVYANGMLEGEATRTLGVVLRPAAHARQLQHVLTALGEVQQAAAYLDLGRLLVAEAGRAMAGSVFVVITAFVSPALTPVLLYLRQRGHKVVVVHFDAPEAGDGPIPAGVVALTPAHLWAS